MMMEGLREGEVAFSNFKVKVLPASITGVGTKILG